MSRRCNPGRAAVILMLALGVAACDDTFTDPFDNDGRYYTVYGFVDQLANFQPGGQHAVRVIPLTRFPERITTPRDDQATIDAVVTSTDLRTGETVRWQHSLERLSGGTYGHVFRAGFLVRQGRTYRLEIQRSDGVTASAETTVPRTAAIETVLAPPRVDAETGHVLQDVTLGAAPSPWNVEVIYHVGSDFSTTPYALAYERAGTPTDDGGWRFTVNLTRDRGRLSALIGVPVDNIMVPAMGLQLRLLDDQWTPPEGVFDPEVLAQPGALTNVENGYGFWGSIALYQHDWPTSDALRDLVGF